MFENIGVQLVAGFGVGVVVAAVLWLFTTAMRNRERIVKLETEMAWQRQTLNNIDGKVDILVSAEARRSGAEGHRS